jgi:hypothetical protein
MWAITKICMNHPTNVPIMKLVFMNLNMHKSQVIGGGWFLCLLLKSEIVHPLLGELHNIPPLFLHHSLEHTAQPQIRRRPCYEKDSFWI